MDVALAALFFPDWVGAATQRPGSACLCKRRIDAVVDADEWVLRGHAARKWSDAW